MTSVSRPESRKIHLSRAVLMRTAATALIATSPFAFSGAAANVSDGVQLTAPILKGKRAAARPQLFAIAADGSQRFQLLSLSLLRGAEAGTLASGGFSLNKPILSGFAAAGSGRSGQPVQNLLAVPMDAKSGRGQLSASAFSIMPMAVVGPISETATGTGPIVIDNADDIVAAPAAAIEALGDQGDVTISNSGDISGVDGIVASTGQLDVNTANADFYTTFTRYGYGDWSSAAYVYDTDGNFVPNPNTWGGYYFKNYINKVTDLFNLDADASDAKLSISNSGNIAFSGQYGVKATNPAGDSIDITNSGDISSTEDTFGRVGVFADSTTHYVEYLNDRRVGQEGEFTYDSYGRLLQGFTPTIYEDATTAIRMKNDDGVVRIENSGSIDMGSVQRTGPFDHIGYAQAVGIQVISQGGIEIENSGSLTVGDFSTGISAVGDGSMNIENSGTLEIGNKSTGIIIGDSPLQGHQIADDYRRSGDKLIVNSGDIIGGMTHAEAAASDNAYAFGFGSIVDEYWEKTFVYGIKADVRNTNNENLARFEQGADEWAYYAEVFKDQQIEIGGTVYDANEFFAPHGYENVENFTTTILNQGDIILKDGGRAISGSAQFGELNVINSGTISVGDGIGFFDENRDFMSGGIMLSNFANDGLGDLYVKNEAGGIVTTGDLSVGLRAQNWYGNNATVINNGMVTVGNGVVGTDYIFNDDYTVKSPYDRVFKSIGMEGVNRGAVHAYVDMQNNGVLTTGDWSLGMRMYANSVGYIGGRLAGQAYNGGTITTGDHSIGIQASGNAAFLVHNSETGTITIGDKDLSGYNPHRHTAGSFELSGFGIFASSGDKGYVVNDGQINTGNGTIGIYHTSTQNPNHWNFASVTAQSETGIISTGDNAIGMKTHSGTYNITSNAGTISVGDYSVGIEATAGAHYTTLVEEIQYGGCHMVNYNNGAGCTVDTVTTGYSYDYAPPNDWDNLAGLTRTEVTQEVAVPGLVQLSNSGVIETGDNSVGVRVAGITGLDYEHYRYVSTPTPYGRQSKRTLKTGTVETDSYVFFGNSGTISVGTDSTGVEITGRHLGSTPQMINYGSILASAGTAIKINVGNTVDSTIYNVGTIVGDILFGDGDDTFLHAENIDPGTGQVLSTGNIIMDGHTIDFGGGDNRFEIRRGVISVAGGDDNLITGDNLTVEMEYGEIDARDDFIVGVPAAAATSMAVSPLSHTTANFSTLTIDGDVSGNFRFAADVDSHGESDELIITGSLLDGTDLGIILNPVEQLQGEIEFRPVNIGGSNDAALIDVAGVTGLYADSLVDWETTYEASSGDVVINAIFGLGHMGSVANAAAVSAQNWLTSSLASHGNRNIHAYTGRKGDGLQVWGYAFQDEGVVKPDNGLQDLSFRQILNGLQAGVTWTRDMGVGRVSISPMATYGTAEANLNANTASSRGHPWSVGLNANLATDGGLYVDATYQRMKMDVDLKTPGTITQATGEASIKGQGFNLEAGYSHRLNSGLVLEPQLQLTHTSLDMDDFASSDGIYSLTGVGGKATTVRAGLSLYKVFETSAGSITPLASLSYLHGLEGEIALASNGVDFDSDVSGSGVKAEFGLLGRHHGWDFAGKLALSKTTATGSILSPSVTVRRSLGGSADAWPASATQQLPEVTEATVKFADAGGSAAPMATAASAEHGAAVVSAAYALTGSEQPETQDGEGDQSIQAAPELEGEQPAEQAGETLGEDNGGEENADIVVTGSIVRRGAPADIAPVTVVTSEEMATKGLLTLGDVLNSFTQNDGLSQGKASNLLGRFTHGAEEVNFRGLGTGRTLVLVNGRRIADYPLPFGGEQNGADLGAIPFSAVANVQYLSSGASATYGSDAVGGVVNIITKRDMEQTAVDLTAGAFQEGYGKTVRASAVTGNSFAKGSFTIGAEATYSGEILASDSKYLRNNAPFEAGMVSILENDLNGLNPVVPQGSCAPLGFEFDSASGECLAEVSDTISLSPEIKKLSAFFDGRYDLTDDIELFATGMAAKSWVEARSNVLFWQGVVGADDNSAATFITRGFSEDELGISTVKVNQFMWSGVLGAKGGFGVGSDVWYWDVAYSYGRYKTDQTTRNLKEEGIKNWILDGAASVTDSLDQRYTYFVDPAFYNGQLIDNIVRPVDSADIDGLVGDNVLKASSSASTLSATLNGGIGDLGFLYKPAKFALRAEYASQTTRIDPDERSLNTEGEGWFNIGTIEANGKRNRWALAGEIDATVLSNLDVMLALRYDHYDDASSVAGRVTGQAKFLYRPTDWLKIRGGYGQTFRAPDMFNLYGESSGFEFVPDYSQPGCFDGTNYFCGYTQVPSTRRADSSLTEEHGDDIGLGAIFNPIPNFTLTVDWYRIKLKDLVITESSSDLILKEWQCDNGVLDGSSHLCEDIRSRVVRNGFGAIEQVIVQPINQDSLTRQGIDIRASYRFETAKLGAFNFDLGYSKVLKFELNRFAGDEPLDLKYGEVGAATPGNGLSAGVSWYKPLTTGKAISAGLFVQRQGRVKDYSGTQFLEPFYDVNLTVGYQLNTKTQARFTVNNLLGTDPVPNGSNVWPGYWAHLQNAFGRSFAISIGHSFN